MVRLPNGSWHGLPRWQSVHCMRCVVSCNLSTACLICFFDQRWVLWPLSAKFVLCQFYAMNIIIQSVLQACVTSLKKLHMGVLL